MPFTTSPLTGIPGTTSRRAIFNGSVFVASSAGVASDKVYVLSSGGTAWAERTLPSSSVWRGATAGDGTILLNGGVVSAVSVDDGASWSPGADLSPMSDIYFGNGVFCWATGSSAYTSVDGTVKNTHPSVFSGTSYSVRGFGGGKFLAFNGTFLYTSTDGASWNGPFSLPAAASAYGQIIWTGSEYLAAHRGVDWIARSADGENWTQQTMHHGSWGSSIPLFFGVIAGRVVLIRSYGSVEMVFSKPIGAQGWERENDLSDFGVNAWTNAPTDGGVSAVFQDFKLTYSPPAAIAAPTTNRSGLIKSHVTTVIPGTPGTPGSPASVTCTPNPPPQPPPPQPPPPPPAVYGYIYVPSNPYNPNMGETRTPWYSSTPPAGYLPFSCGTYWVPDPLFPGGLTPVFECRSYWNYP